MGSFDSGMDQWRALVNVSSEAHPASYPMITGGKARLRRDADHSPSSCAGVKNYELYSSPSCRLHGGNGTALFLYFSFFRTPLRV